MNAAIVDASIAATWLLPDEQTDVTDALLHDLSSTEAFVPSIFWHEIRNILIVAERRKRIRSDQALRLITRLDSLNLQDAGHGRDDALLFMAMAHSLTAYDAAYLALATSMGAPLITLDRKLGAAANREGVVLIGPIAG